MTFREIQDRVLEELGYDISSVSSIPRERVKRRINDWHRKLLTRPHFTRLLRSSYQFSLTTTSGQANYALPRGMDKVAQITDTSNDVALMPWRQHEMRIMDPGESTLGVPTAWAVRGWYAYHTAPATAVTKLYAASSSASDTQVVSFLLVTDTDQQVETTLTLNGTSSVYVTVAAEEIHKVWLSTAAVGDITLRYEAAAGTVFAVIPAGATTVRYLWIRLYPIPGGTYTLAVEGIRELTNLVDDHDLPYLPTDFHDILALGAEADEWKKKDDTRYTVCRQECESRVNDLKAWVYNAPDYLVGPLTIDDGSSRLGGWYPSGS